MKLRIVTAIVLTCAIVTWADQRLLNARLDFPIGTAYILHMAHPYTVLGMQVLLIASLALCFTALFALLRRPAAVPSGQMTKIDRAVLYGSVCLIAGGLWITLHSVAWFQNILDAMGRNDFELQAPIRIAQLQLLGFALWPAAFSLIVQQIALNRQTKKAPA